jgi:hypothetical protein
MTSLFVAKRTVVPDSLQATSNGVAVNLLSKSIGAELSSTDDRLSRKSPVRFTKLL